MLDEMRLVQDDTVVSHPSRPLPPRHDTVWAGRAPWMIIDRQAQFQNCLTTGGTRLVANTVRARIHMS
jgi:hypothetical protein